VTNENGKARELTAPTVKTLKLLFARSGNKCAFPRCAVAIIDGNTVIGEVCHIKGEKPGAARYDANQTAAERHAYDNLILLCRNHHRVIDDDEEAYTVERLHKMKSDHEQRAAAMAEDFVNQAAGLLIDNSVTTSNQSGGITAHTVNIHNYPPLKAEAAPVDSSSRFPAAEPKDGQARFRLRDQSLGVNWNPIPYATGIDREIFLSVGAAMWLRVMPRTNQGRSWSADELRKCATHGNITLQPFLWTSLEYLRAEDGFGTYAITGNQETETKSVAFAFETGEIWSVDTSILNIDKRKNLYFLDIARAFVVGLHNYGLFLSNLGVEPPFGWIAGLEGVKGWRLQLPTPHGRASVFPGNSCLSESITANGSYDLKQTPGVALRPFFTQICRKCAMEYSEFVRSHVEQPLA